MTKCFTEDEVIRLCKAIREYPSLYDPAAPNFGKSLPNKLVWEKISELFIEEKINSDATKEILKKFNADDVKLKWKNLRDTMALLLRKSNRDPNTWRFYEYVKFLNNYERPYRKKTRKAEKSSFEPPMKLEKLSTETKFTISPSVTVTTPISLPAGLQQKFIVTSSLPTPTTITSTDLANISITSPIQKLALQRPTATIIAAKDESPTSTIQSLRHVEESPPLCAEESSREPLNFDEASRDSLLHQLASQAPSIVHASPLTHQHNLQRLQTQSPFIPQNSREIYEIFGEEVAVRLRAIDNSGNRALFLKTRRDINHILDQAEMEMFNQQQQPPQH